MTGMPSPIPSVGEGILGDIGWDDDGPGTTSKPSPPVRKMEGNFLPEIFWNPRSLDGAASAPAGWLESLQGLNNLIGVDSLAAAAAREMLLERADALSFDWPSETTQLV